MKTFLQINVYDRENEDITIIAPTEKTMEQWLNFIGVMAIDARDYCKEKGWNEAAKEYDEFIDKILGNKLE